MGASILTARNLSKVVPSAEGELTILHELSLELNKGDSLAIVGASGSGKSTLLGLLAGLDLPSSGSVSIDGHAISTLDEDGRAKVRAARVGFVFQSFALLPRATNWRLGRLNLVLIVIMQIKLIMHAKTQGITALII